MSAIMFMSKFMFISAVTFRLYLSAVLLTSLAKTMSRHKLIDLESHLRQTGFAFMFS